MMNRVYATITAVDTPAPKYYQARTCFGREFTAVSLRGLNHPLTVGQKCAVFEVDGGLSAVDDAGTYPAILSVPGELKAGFCSEAKAKASLFLIASIAGNVEQYYSLASVTAINGSTLTVAGDKVNGQIGVLGLSASDFVVGDRVVVYHDHKPPVVIGWWSVPQTWKPSVFALYLSFKFGTIKPTLTKYQIDEDGISISAQSEVMFDGPYNPLSTMLFHTTQMVTTDGNPYLYSIARYTTGLGVETEKYYLCWSKDMTGVETIDEGDYPAPLPVSYSLTADGKYWWSGVIGENCKQSDTETGTKYEVFPGEGDSYGVWLPAEGQIYTAL